MSYETEFNHYLIYGVHRLLPSVSVAGEDAFNRPYAVATNDNTGDIIVADYGGSRIKKIDTSGKVTTMVPPKGKMAAPCHPCSVFVHQNTIYYGDNCNIRKYTDGAKGSKLPVTYAAEDSLRFNWITGMAMDKDENFIIVDCNSHKIRKLHNGTVTTLGGGSAGLANGHISTAKFHYPWGIVIDEMDNIFVSDSDNHLVRKIDKDGTVSTFAGDSQSRVFKTPRQIAYNQHTGTIYVADSKNDAIKAIDKTGTVRKVTVPKSLIFTSPCGVTVRKNGNLIVADTKNNRIVELISDYPARHWPQFHLLLPITRRKQVEELLLSVDGVKLPKDLRILIVSTFLLMEIYACRIYL